MIGECYRLLGEWGNAERYYADLARRYANSEWADNALFTIAEHYANGTSRRDIERAVATFRQIVEQHGQGDYCARALNGLGEALLILKQWAPATEPWSRPRPGTPRAWAWRQGSIWPVR